MLIIFDQNALRPLRKFLPNHTVKTAGEMGWATLTNSDLLNAADEARFEVLVTSDQNLTSQQNLARRRIGVVVLGNGNRNGLAAVVIFLPDCFSRWLILCAARMPKCRMQK